MCWSQGSPLHLYQLLSQLSSMFFSNMCSEAAHMLSYCKHSPQAATSCPNKPGNSASACGKSLEETLLLEQDTAVLGGRFSGLAGQLRWVGCIHSQLGEENRLFHSENIRVPKCGNWEGKRNQEDRRVRMWCEIPGQSMRERRERRLVRQ